MINIYDNHEDEAIYGQVWTAEPTAWGRKVSDSMRLGDAFSHRSEHNAPVGYNWLTDNCNQLRFAFISGCTAAQGSLSLYQTTYGGGNLLAMGSLENTSWGNFRLGEWLVKDSNDLAERLSGGEPLGQILVEAATYSNYFLPIGTMAYGDLSIRAKVHRTTNYPASRASTCRPAIRTSAKR